MDIKEKELMIIRCSAMGYTNKDIAKDMNISESYVKYILDSLFYRTQTKNKAHLVDWAYRNKIIGD